MSRLASYHVVGYDSDANDPPRPARFPPPLQPYLFACFPPLVLLAHDPQAVSGFDVLAALGITLAMAFVAHVLCCLVYPTPESASLAAAWTVVWTFGFGLLALGARVLDHAHLFHFTAWQLAAIWAVAWLWGLAALHRQLASERQFAGTALLGAACLLIGPLAVFAYQLTLDPQNLPWGPPPAALAHVTLAAAPPTDAKPTAHPAPPPVDAASAPDLLFVAVDGLPCGAALKSAWKHDNADWLRRLAGQGFAVCETQGLPEPRLRTAWAETLNLQALGPEQHGRRALRHALRGHQLGQIALAHGYRVLHLGSNAEEWRAAEGAEWNYTTSPVPSEYFERLWSWTPAAACQPVRTWAEQNEDKFAFLESWKPTDKPQCLTAHFVLPGFTSQAPPGVEALYPATADFERRYRELLEFENRLENVLRGLTRRSGRPCVVVLEAIGGVGPPPVPGMLPPPPPAKGMLTAIHLPGRKKLPPEAFLPENPFRLVLSEVLRADLPLIPRESEPALASDGVSGAAPTGG